MPAPHKPKKMGRSGAWIFEGADLKPNPVLYKSEGARGGTGPRALNLLGLKITKLNVKSRALKKQDGSEQAN